MSEVSPLQTEEQRQGCPRVCGDGVVVVAVDGDGENDDGDGERGRIH